MLLLFALVWACPRPERFRIPHLHVINNNTQGRILHYVLFPHIINDRYTVTFLSCLPMNSHRSGKFLFIKHFDNVCSVLTCHIWVVYDILNESPQILLIYSEATLTPFPRGHVISFHMFNIKGILVPRAYDLLVSGWIVGPGNSR